MGTLKLMTMIVKFLPEIRNLLKTADKRMKEGATNGEIKRSMKRINDAFAHSNRAKGAKMLDNMWS